MTDVSNHMKTLDRDNIPAHIAVIMDGNGRWARKRLLNRINGHKKGMDAVKAVVSASREIGVRYLTLYAFSTENWRRPAEEVGALMSLLTTYLKSELKMMMENGIRLTTIGNIDDIPEKTRKVLVHTVDATAGNSGMVLNLALSYGGRDDILHAARTLASKVRDGEISPEDIDEELFSANLLTAGMPDPDLLIRTSGEMRLSNFLLWQNAYAEFCFPDTLWPDFGKEELFAAIRDYQSRERRFGKTSEQLSPEVKAS